MLRGIWQNTDVVATENEHLAYVSHLLVTRIEIDVKPDHKCMYMIISGHPEFKLRFEGYVLFAHCVNVYADKLARAGVDLISVHGVN